MKQYSFASLFSLLFCLCLLFIQYLQIIALYQQFLGGWNFFWGENNCFICSFTLFWKFTNIYFLFDSYIPCTIVYKLYMNAMSCSCTGVYPQYSACLIIILLWFFLSPDFRYIQMDNTLLFMHVLFQVWSYVWQLVLKLHYNLFIFLCNLIGLQIIFFMPNILCCWFFCVKKFLID